MRDRNSAEATTKLSSGTDPLTDLVPVLENEITSLCDELERAYQSGGDPDWGGWPAGILTKVESCRVLILEVRAACARLGEKRLAGLLHDLSNRFTPVLWQLELASVSRSELGLRKALARVLLMMPPCRDLSARMRGIFNGAATATPNVCKPGEVIGRTLEEFRLTLPSRVALVQSLWPKLRPVGMAVGDVQSVIYNLLDNAATAIGEGKKSHGTILVLAHNVVVRPEATLPQRGTPPSQGSFVLVAVRDDGPGMSAEVQARLFQWGFTTKAPGKGTGIGLAAVRDLLCRAGGGITFRSVPRTGSRFNVFFPAVGG